MPKMLIEIDPKEQVVVPRVPTVSNAMKYKFMGEFEWAACDAQFDEDGNVIEQEIKRTVPWDLCKAIYKQMAAHWVSEQQQSAQPAPIPTGWQRIETAPTDVLHVRGLWVYDEKGKPLSFDCDVGRIDDDGFFVDEFGNVHGWRAEDYTHWHPLEVPPAPGGSDD